MWVVDILDLHAFGVTASAIAGLLTTSSAPLVNGILIFLRIRLAVFISTEPWCFGGSWFAVEVDGAADTDGSSWLFALVFKMCRCWTRTALSATGSIFLNIFSWIALKSLKNSNFIKKLVYYIFKKSSRTWRLLDGRGSHIKRLGRLGFDGICQFFFGFEIWLV